MKAIVQEIISGANTVLEQIAKAKLGLDPSVTDPILNGAEADLASVVDKLGQHPALQTASATGTAALPTVAAVLAFGLLVLGLGAGCGSLPHDVAHVYRLEGTGNKLALSQNPVTGLYELGWQRVQTEYVQVPVVFTNGEFYIPPMVAGYEANGHSAIFGNIAVTSTMATGSNAVNTTLGGMHWPINSGTGTSNNLAYPITTSTPAK